MAITETLANLRLRSRQRADQVNSQFVTDSELDSYINTFASELYDKLVSAYGEGYYVQSADFTTTNDKDTYNLETEVGIVNFYKVIGVDYFVTTGTSIPIRKFNWLDRTRGSGVRNRIYSTDTRYRIVGNDLRLIPPPDSSDVMRVWYIPAMTKMVVDGDTFDGINGWEDFIVLSAARRMMAKEEQDTKPIDAEIGVISARIDEMKEDRDLGEPESIADVHSINYDADDGFAY